MSMHTSRTISPGPAQPPAGLAGGPEALERLRSTLLALPADRTGVIRVHAPDAVTSALQVARAYLEDRDRLTAAFTPAAFDPTAYDDVEQRALALWQADVDYRLLVDPEEALPPLLERATPLRRKLLHAAQYLWQDHPVLGVQVAEIRRGRGHLDLADDLTALASLFEAHWTKARNRCAVVAGDLAEARELGVAIAHALTRDDSALGRARDLRRRAAAHLRHAVDDIRAAAAFVFRADPDRLAAYPSLFVSHKRARPTRTPEATPTGLPAAPQPGADGAPPADTGEAPPAGPENEPRAV